MFFFLYLKPQRPVDKQDVLFTVDIKTILVLWHCQIQRSWCRCYKWLRHFLNQWKLFTFDLKTIFNTCAINGGSICDIFWLFGTFMLDYNCDATAKVAMQYLRHGSAWLTQHIRFCIEMPLINGVRLGSNRVLIS